MELSNCHFLVNALRRLNRGDDAAQALNQAVAEIAVAAGAGYAWLYQADTNNAPARLTAGYQLPAGPDAQKEPPCEQRCWQSALEPPAGRLPGEPFIASCAPLQPDAGQKRAAGSHVAIPLYDRHVCIGLLNLAYEQTPAQDESWQTALNDVGQAMSSLLTMLRVQDEGQLYATQIAFMLLLARNLGNNLSLSQVTALALEQAVNSLNAAGGDLWLFSRDDQTLEPHSSLRPANVHSPPKPRRRGGGLISHVAEDGEIIVLERCASDPRFEPELDCIFPGRNCAWIGVPLRHQKILIGAISLYRATDQPFSQREALLLEGIATLSASAIATTRIMEELQGAVEQQRVLYEMSRQIAGGLDLSSTLKRTLGWASRLCSAEISLLWLLEENEEKPLTLAAALGLEHDCRPLALPLKGTIIGWAVQRQQAVLSNDPLNDERCNRSLPSLLQISLRDIIITPMRYRGKVIGALSLINRIGGKFNHADLSLLATATEMAAIAVGNARLHAQTVALLAEREQLHKQAVQKERLAIIGRLTSSLSHEINNPMQAIRGALTLALEELDDPEALQEYIQLCLEQSGRVARLISRLRSVYRPQSDAPELLDLNHLLQEALAIANKEISYHDVIVQLELTPGLPPVRAVAGQIELVFLNLILHLSDLIGDSGGGKLWVRSYAAGQEAVVDFKAGVESSAVANWTATPEPGMPQQTNFDLLLSHDIIQSLDGSIKVLAETGQTIVRIVLNGYSD